MRVSLRVTVTNRNVRELLALFDLSEREGIPRVCVYHLVCAGRGEKLLRFDLKHEERRKMIEYVFERTIESYVKGNKLEVLTVDNHTAAAYLQMCPDKNMPDQSLRIRSLQ
jgi:MoaA/NifB/PqqE/SkfB family radical SAM enzyme|tara:strand:+ start:331 stop:663 length:333 start_codon:yes stop_codon:yes gene_type:complete